MNGTEEATIPRLADLSDAVPALHAHLFDGDAAESGAVRMNGSGSSSDPGPLGFKIIEAACSGTRAEQFLKWWSADYSPWKGDPSDGDWFGANEAAYHLIHLGYDAENAAATLEQTLRAGPWREKWDSPRPGQDDDGKTIRTTILGLLIGKALKRQRKRAAGPTVVAGDADWFTPEDENQTPPDETLEQETARVKRELAHARAVIAQQQTVIRNERTLRETAECGKRAADELVKAIYDTLAIPDEQLAARPKLVSLALAREAASRNSRGIFTMSNLTLACLTGQTEKVVSQIMQDLPARDGTPFERIVTREYVEVAPGIKEPRSIAQVRITTPDQTTVSVIRALPSIGGPSDKEMQRKAKAQASAAASTEAKIAAEVGKRIAWGWCSTHESTDVTIKGHCSACGEVVGERQMTGQEFSLLNPEMRDSAIQHPRPTVDVVTLPVQMRDSAPQTTVESQDRAMRDSVSPISLFDYTATRSQPGDEIGGPRCGQPRRNGESCRASVYIDLGGGSLRCRGCAAIHEPLAAVAGAAE